MASILCKHEISPRCAPRTQRFPFIFISDLRGLYGNGFVSSIIRRSQDRPMRLISEQTRYNRRGEFWMIMLSRFKGGRPIAAALLFLAVCLFSVGRVGSTGLRAPLAQASDAYELIDAVNALRIANGLPPYNTHPILMGVSQAHAQYMASAGTVTHYGADGSRPYQRALAAGYPVAGDLSQGGFFSENIIAGNSLSAQGAVERWLGDAPHTNTILSTYAQDIGAGAVTVGSYVYYVIDVGLATGSTPRFTPGPGGTFPTAEYYAPLVSTIMPNTPAADGAVRHTVKGGETLWLIAITYGTKVDAIRNLNHLAADAPLRPGRDLLIFPPGTMTPPPSMRIQPTMLALLVTATPSAPRAGSGPGDGSAGPSADGSLLAANLVPEATPRALGADPTSDPRAPPFSKLGLIAMLVGASLLAAVFFSFRRRNAG